MLIGKIQGQLSLDEAALLAPVYCYDAEDGSLVGRVTSTAEGAFHCVVNNVDSVFVTAVPPSGYQAITHGPLVPQVLVVGTSDTHFLTATSITETVPAAVVAGDVLIASLMHRAALLPPDGWERIWWSDDIDPSGTHQQLSVYQRVADATDASAGSTWSMASSQRIALNITALRGAEVISTASATGVTKGVITMPTVTAAGNELVLSIATSVYAASTATNTFTVSSDWYQLTPVSSSDSTNQIRIGVAIRGGPGDLTGNFTLNMTETRTSAVVVNVLLRLDQGETL